MGDSQVEQVKEKVDIVEIIGERVALKKAGRNFKGLCPFHGEKTPSFFVTPDMQMYKCFGCGAAGDVFNFLQNYEGKTFAETLEMLAKKVGVTLIKRMRSDEESKRERALEILHLAKEYYAYLLMSHRVGTKARIYLKGRGVTKESIEEYGIGYAPDSWRGLGSYLSQKKGYKEEEIINTGMMIWSDKGRGYDRYLGRIVFQHKTVSGHTVGFSGRVLNPEVKEAKYINTPETAYYHKGELLYGLSVARRAIKAKDRVVIVEGELDVISSHQTGLKEVVAVKGSALTEGQIQLIRRLTQKLILALDADEAGQEAIRRAIELSEPAGMNLRVVRLTGGKDPDEICRHEPAAWKRMVDEAVSVYQFYLDTAWEKYEAETGDGQKMISQMLLPVWARIANSIEQAFWVKKLAEKLGVRQETVTEEMRKWQMGTVKETKAAVADMGKERKLSRRERLERYVLTAWMHLPDELRVERLAEIKAEWFGEKYLQRLRIKMEKSLSDVKSVKEGLKGITRGLEVESQQLARELFAEDSAFFGATEEEREAAFERATRDLRALVAKEKVVEVNKRMARGEVSEEEKAGLQRDLRIWEKESR